MGSLGRPNFEQGHSDAVKNKSQQQEHLKAPSKSESLLLSHSSSVTQQPSLTKSCDLPWFPFSTLWLLLKHHKTASAASMFGGREACRKQRQGWHSNRGGRRHFTEGIKEVTFDSEEGTMDSKIKTYNVREERGKKGPSDSHVGWCIKNPNAFPSHDCEFSAKISLCSFVSILLSVCLSL